MKVLLSLFLLFTTCLCFSQGKIDGFYQGQGNATIVVGGGIEDSNEYLAGKDKTGLERKTYYISLFTSYGITNNLDINVSLPYIESGRNKNFQDISIMLKNRFFDKVYTNSVLELSGSAGISTPVSDYKIGGLFDIGQQATIIESRVMSHYKINSGWLATLQSGFSYKLEEVPNSVPLTLKVGRAKKNIYYDIYYDAQFGLGGIDYLGTPRPQNFREFGVSYHKVGATIFAPIIDGFGAYGTFSYIIGGRNIFLGPIYGAGLSYNFSRD
ncbi:hypothetical protein [Patiriisocius hiemis]|uniref:Uncharacterized protein n=1 Tax=Patiriisocius hiemis TaxID=3075604 RepID=A0ABU2YD08_9FLAO|nr:hypothetical protein [Constantimarinum sp. W242]MDT0556074.1 hypothetical protein [Constantimarinum sp. W242]